MFNSYKTAISRTKPSAPMKFLSSNNLLIGSKLDYGCGKGFDATFHNMDRFDPYYFPTPPTQKYQTITCNYVLNTITEEQASNVMLNLKHLLKVNGNAYVTVRRDLKKDGLTSKGTYQRNVILNFPIVRQTSSYCIYLIKK